MRKWMIAGLLVGSALVVSSSLGIAQEPVKIQYWNINTENFGGPAVRELIAKPHEVEELRDTVHRLLKPRATIKPEPA